MFGTNNGIAGHVLMVGGTEEQKARWLPRMASGEVTGVVRADRARGGLRPVGAHHDPGRTATATTG